MIQSSVDTVVVDVGSQDLDVVSAARCRVAILVQTSVIIRIAYFDVIERNVVGVHDVD